MPVTSNNCKLEKQQSKFIDYLKYEKRRSSHTVTAYESDLSQFIVFVKAEYSIEECSALTHKIIRSWIVQLVEIEQNPRSIRRKLSALNSWFNFLLRKGEVEANIAKQVITPKVPKRLTVALPEPDLGELFSGDYFGNDFAGIRDRTIFELFYATGIRLSELVGLKVNDYDQSASVLHVLGKRNKQRLLPVGPLLAVIITDYMTIRNQLPAIHSDTFFLTEKGEKIYHKLVYRIINTYLSKVSSVEKRSPHVLRHTFATHLLSKGADINAIKELLGHASLAATQVYTHTNIEKLKNIHKQAHPRA